MGDLVISNAATLNALLAWQNSGSMSMRGGTVIGAGITTPPASKVFGAINAQVVNDAGATLTADRPVDTGAGADAERHGHRYEWRVR